MIYKNYLGLLIGIFVFLAIAVFLSVNEDIDKSNVLSSSTFNAVPSGFRNTQAAPFSILVTGDLMPGRYVNIQTKTSKDPMWAYKNILTHLENEFVFANLESPIISNCKDDSNSMIFCAPEYAAESLSSAGVDIVSLANNHILNHGRDGLLQTQKFLDKYGVKFTGVTNPTIIDLEGNKIAFLAFDDIECNVEYIECADEDNIKGDILEAKNNSDLVVIMFHWGAEYRYEPTLRQVRLAHFAIDNGADLVVGNHPHWYQKFERYQDKLIGYSHGNFVFDQMWSLQTREGITAKYEYNGLKFIGYEIFPIIISNYGQPQLAEEPYRLKIINHLKSISLTQ